MYPNEFPDSVSSTECLPNLQYSPFIPQKPSFTFFYFMPLREGPSFVLKLINISMSYDYLIAPCGKDCFLCPLYTGEKNRGNRDAFLRKNKLSADQFQCKGCRENHGFCLGLKLQGLSPVCSTYQCVQSKKVKYCFECDQFPCNRLRPASCKAGNIAACTEKVCTVYDSEFWATANNDTAYSNEAQPVHYAQL